jgi:hypothetical protein
LRFDPLTANRYTYVNGDPVNVSDPDGHCGCSMNPYAQHCDPAGTDPSGNALVQCGNAESPSWHFDPNAIVPHEIHGLSADIYKTRDFLQTIGTLAKGCVTSWQGVAGCASVLAALAGQEEVAAALAVGADAPAVVDCAQHPSWGECAAAAVGLLPAGGVAGTAIVRRLLEANVGDAVAGGALDEGMDSAGVSGTSAKPAAAGGTAGLPTISASTNGVPSAIARGYGTLSSAQLAVLDQLDKRAFGQQDLSALTAATGDEFAMFSTGGRRMIIRRRLERTCRRRHGAAACGPGMALLRAHSPGFDYGVLRSSEGDRAVLAAFGGAHSAILNSMGRWQLFSPEVDYLWNWLP